MATAWNVHHVELIAYAAPLYTLVLPLVAGRHIGEETLERLREGREPGRRRAHHLLGPYT